MTDLPSADAKHHSSCMSTYLLFQYGEIGNEPQDTAVPHGTFRYFGHNECVHAYQL